MTCATKNKIIYPAILIQVDRENGDKPFAFGVTYCLTNHFPWPLWNMVEFHCQVRLFNALDEMESSQNAQASPYLIHLKNMVKALFK